MQAELTDQISGIYFGPLLLSGQICDILRGELGCLTIYSIYFLQKCHYRHFLEYYYYIINIVNNCCMLTLQWFVLFNFWQLAAAASHVFQ